MTDAVLLPETPGLSQGERVVDTFFAPSKTFTDIIRNQSWWLPAILVVLLTVAFAWTVGSKVGFESVAEHSMTRTPAAAERWEGMPPDQRAKMLKGATIGTKVFSYGFWVAIFLIVAIEALVLWGCFNFLLGAKTTYPQVFAVLMYAGLPRAFVTLLAIVLLFAGVGTDNFDMQNPVGTNLGYYMTSPALKAGGAFFDVFGIWGTILLIIGMATISRKTIGQSASIIGGIWVIMLLLITGVTALMS